MTSKIKIFLSSNIASLIAVIIFGAILVLASAINLNNHDDYLLPSYFNEEKSLELIKEIKAFEKICDQMPSGKEKDECYGYLLIRKPSQRVCDKFSTDELKLNCYFFLIEQGSEDSSLCNKLPSGTSFDRCIAGVAKSLKNISLCDKIENLALQNYCLITIDRNSVEPGTCGFTKDPQEEGSVLTGASTCRALEGNPIPNSTICDQVEFRDSNLKDACYEVVATFYSDSGTDSTELCDKIINVSKKEDCYHSVAIDLGNVSMCDEISNQTWKELCYSGLALKTQDPSLCNKLSNTKGVEQCLSSVADSVETCESIISSQYASKYKNECFFKLAQSTNNTEVCELISIDYQESIYSSTYRQDDCYFGIAKKDMDYKICSNISDSKTKNRCYQEVGILSSDPEACSKIVGYQLGGWLCYKDIAVEKKDISICNGFNDTDPNDQYSAEKCRNHYYWNIAEETGDTSICNKVVNDDSFKEQCIEHAKWSWSQ